MENEILQGDCLELLKTLPDNYFNSCVTSPPYWRTRDYEVPPSDWPEVTFFPMPGLPTITVPRWKGCLGLEPTPEMFVGHIVLIFREVYRVLRKDGTLWLNFGDTFVSTASGTMGDNIHIEGALEATKKARKILRPDIPNGLKSKDIVGIPWRVAFALQADGWYLRSDNIWHKLNPMPENVKDRPTKAHEYIFLLSKSSKYYYDAKAIEEPLACPEASKPDDIARAFNKRRIVTPNVNRKLCKEPNKELPTGRNKRSVWTIPTNSFFTSHFAAFPERLIEPCVLAGCQENGIVLDPFFGSGTTGVVAIRYGRRFIGIELNPNYIKIADRRLSNVQTKLNLV